MEEASSGAEKKESSSSLKPDFDETEASYTNAFFAPEE
jgi:hypothetical protein